MEPRLKDLFKAISEIKRSVFKIEQHLQSVGTGGNHDNDDMLTILQLAELLDLTVPILYGYVRKRKIPFFKKGKRLYFSKQEIIAWIKKGKVFTETELDLLASRYTNFK